MNVIYERSPSCSGDMAEWVDDSLIVSQKFSQKFSQNNSKKFVQKFSQKYFQKFS